MYTSLEEKRRLIEDLELLDYAITKRLQVNPKIYKPKENNHQILVEDRRISNANTILQQHEIKQFLTKVESERETLVQLLSNEETNLHDWNLLKQPDNSNDFTKFMALCDESVETSQTDQKLQKQSNILKDHEIYDMFSCNDDYQDLKRKISDLENPSYIDMINLKKKNKKSKKKNIEKYRILSSFTADIKLSLLFTPAEVFGTQFDLRLSYTEWLSLPRNKSISTTAIPKYKSFIHDILNRSGDIKVDTLEYRQYLTNLHNYFIKYVAKLNPFETISKGETKDTSEIFSFDHPDFFCLACNKQFAKDSVYNSHLNGKKHIKNAEKMKDVLHSESAIKKLLSTKLHNQLDKTIKETERTDLLTVRERELEKQESIPQNSGEFAPLDVFFGFEKSNRKHRKDDEDAEGDNDDDDDEDDDDSKLYNPLNLPIGPDGRPIPFWLWKIKGLGHEFHCEICGDITYKGRSTYNKHFKDVTHIDGLKALGITDNFAYFRDLNKKKDVLQLQETLQRKLREQVQFMDNTEQVEDDEGNAMNKKVYEQLQKQGLL